MKKHESQQTRNFLSVFMLMVTLGLMTVTKGDGLVGYTVTDYAEVVTFVFKYYHSQCILLLYTKANLNTGLQDLQMLLQLEKSLSGLGRGLQILTVRLGTYNHDIKKLQCRNENPPLCVVVSSEAATRRELKKLFQNQGMSQSAWLLFSNNISVQDFFTDINIPFDCKFLVAQSRGNKIDLTEVYRIEEKMPLLTYFYGTWSLNNGITRTETKLYQRRNQLTGLVMKGASTDNPPITTLEEISDELYDVKGFFGAVWEILQHRINFTTAFKNVTAHGTLVNGSWNGMIGLLRTREVDVALSEFTMSGDRMTVVDFAIPLIYTGYNVFIRLSSHEDLQWGDFMEPFSTGLWFTICSSIVIISCLLSSLHVIGRRCGNAEADGPSRYGLYDSLHYVFGIFCQQGHDFTPKSSSCRVVYLTAYLTAVVLLSAYSAALISFLTKKSAVMPFTDLRGLLRDGSYKLGVIEKSAEYEMFEKSNDEHMKKLFTKLLRDEKNLPPSHEEGFKRVCSSRYAFLSTIHSVTEQLVTCGPLALPGETFPASLTFALTKNSPYTGIINYNLQILKDKGVLKGLRMKYWKPQLPKVKSPWITVDFYSIAPILVVLSAGIGTASVFLMLERKWHGFHLHRSQRPRHCKVTSGIHSRGF